MATLPTVGRPIAIAVTHARAAARGDVAVLVVLTVGVVGALLRRRQPREDVLSVREASQRRRGTLDSGNNDLALGGRRDVEELRATSQGGSQATAHCTHGHSAATRVTTYLLHYVVRELVTHHRLQRHATFRITRDDFIH
jgi:hypothetical protein